MLFSTLICITFLQGLVCHAAGPSGIVILNSYSLELLFVSGSIFCTIFKSPVSQGIPLSLCPVHTPSLLLLFIFESTLLTISHSDPLNPSPKALSAFLSRRVIDLVFLKHPQWKRNGSKYKRSWITHMPLFWCCALWGFQKNWLGTMSFLLAESH